MSGKHKTEPKLSTFSKSGQDDKKKEFKNDEAKEATDKVLSVPYKFEDPGFLATFHDDQEVTQLV